MKMEGPKIKFLQKTPTILNLILLEYYISIFRKGPYGLVIFNRTQNKVDFISKSLYIETLAGN